MTSTSYQPSIIQNINNSTISAIKSMPQKDSTSDGTSTFELGRKIYVKTYSTATGPNVQRFNQLSNPQIANTNISVPLITSKKWLGNRDASQVATDRRNTAIGLGSLNAANQPMSFTTNDNVNVRKNALSRVRAGGAVAPAKKGANRNNAPTPSFAPAPNLKSIYGLKTPTLYH